MFSVTVSKKFLTKRRRRKAMGGNSVIIKGYSITNKVISTCIMKNLNKISLSMLLLCCLPGKKVMSCTGIENEQSPVSLSFARLKCPIPSLRLCNGFGNREVIVEFVNY